LNSSGLHSEEPPTHTHIVAFQLSPSILLALLAALFFVAQSVSYLIAPFQSPDEFSHVKRAYLLSKGQITTLLHDNKTGGYVDVGLLEYMKCFDQLPFRYEQRVSFHPLSLCAAEKWHREEKFTDFADTANYFPLIYAPQAIALAIGRKMELGVQNSYYLARFLSLSATLAIIYAAFRIYPLPLSVLALFATPMTLFQMGSASQDSVAFAVTTIATALFLRGANRAFSFTNVMHLTLASCAFVVCTARLNLLPMTILPALLHSVRPSRWRLASATAVVLLTLLWIAYAFVTVHQPISHDLTATQVSIYYATHPASFFRVFYNTLTDFDSNLFYATSFIGTLGCLDTPLNPSAYIACGLLLLLIIALGIKRPNAQLLDTANIALVLISLSCWILLYVIFLLVWTDQPATIITGVQGRYFTLILILLLPALSNGSLSRWPHRLSIGLVFLLLQVSAIATWPTLLHRYWISEIPTAQASTSDLNSRDR
jgi:uncharacterized membrane protein